MRRIDKVNKLVTCSNEVRVIMGADKYARLSPGPRITYEGKGQVIAIVDQGSNIGQI